MTGAIPPLRILGLANAAERPVLIEAGQQLLACLSRAAEAECTAELAFAPPGADPSADAAIVILSLLGDVVSDEPVASIALRWHAWFDRLSRAGGRKVVVATLFRAVDDPVARAALVARIRRLNDLAISMSRAHDIEIGDVDRACALLGTAVLGSDYRCASPHAARVAGHVIVSALLAADLAPHVPAPLQERARALHGTLGDFLDRHRQDAS